MAVPNQLVCFSLRSCWILDSRLICIVLMSHSYCNEANSRYYSSSHVQAIIQHFVRTSEHRSPSTLPSTYVEALVTKSQYEDQTQHYASSPDTSTRIRTEFQSLYTLLTPDACRFASSLDNPQG